MHRNLTGYEGDRGVFVLHTPLDCDVVVYDLGHVSQGAMLDDEFLIDFSEGVLRGLAFLRLSLDPGSRGSSHVPVDGS